LSEETKETIEVSQAISILATEVKKTNDRLQQIETASRGEPVQQAPQQNDAFNSPLTLKSLLTELPNIIQMAKQTGLIKNENQDPLANYKYAIGEKALDRVFEDLNKSLFEKAERKSMNDLVHSNEAGIQ
jgi:hypothetical protein|tara:strand:- start:6230 stop:6619 length:390 start_codon:yes stop_codon:yes gene_type:complete